MSRERALLRRLVEAHRTVLGAGDLARDVFSIAAEAEAMLTKPEGECTCDMGDGPPMPRCQVHEPKREANRWRCAWCGVALGECKCMAPPAARVEQPTVDEIAEGTRIILDTPVVDKVCKWMMAMARADERSRTPPAAPECDDDIHDELCDCNQARPHISRAEGSDLSVDQGREFRVVDGLGDSNRAGKVTIDPTLLSPPTPRSRAEAEAMVEAYGLARIDFELTNEGLRAGNTRIAREKMATARAALLAALSGEDK